jgi:2,4-dienoyl-CoA reductase-like NADH-dependent reductase (Old Yellow Enzyme family)
MAFRNDLPMLSEYARFNMQAGGYRPAWRERESQLTQFMATSRLLAREVLRLRGKEATEAQIQCVLEEFADAARRAK